MFVLYIFTDCVLANRSSRWLCVLLWFVPCT